LADTDSQLVHHLGWHMTGGITAQMPEHPRAAQSRVHVRAPGHDMEVDMLKALCLSEERDIGQVKQLLRPARR
jgi:hypothetical protein